MLNILKCNVIIFIQSVTGTVLYSAILRLKAQTNTIEFARMNSCAQRSCSYEGREP